MAEPKDSKVSFLNAVDNSDADQRPTRTNSADTLAKSKSPELGQALLEKFLATTFEIYDKKSPICPEVYLFRKDTQKKEEVVLVWRNLIGQEKQKEIISFVDKYVFGRQYKSDLGYEQELLDVALLTKAVISTEDANILNKINFKSNEFKKLKDSGELNSAQLTSIMLPGKTHSDRDLAQINEVLDVGKCTLSKLQKILEVAENRVYLLLLKTAEVAIQKLLMCEGITLKDPESSNNEGEFKPGDIVGVRYEKKRSMHEHVDGGSNNLEYGTSGFVCNLSIGADTIFQMSTWESRKDQKTLTLYSGDVVVFNGANLFHKITVTAQNPLPTSKDNFYTRYSIQLRDNGYVRRYKYSVENPAENDVSNAIEAMLKKISSS